MEKTRLAAQSVLEALGLSDAIHHLYIDHTDSPWNEKVLVKRKKEYLDVKLTVWNDNLFLYGRIYRLLLHVFDTLDRNFGYDPRKVPREEAASSSVEELYTQIWSIYVDSRMEKSGIPNFYDKAMRRNLFVDARKDLAWNEARALFDELWNRTSFTHQEILTYAHNLDKMLKSNEDSGLQAPEVEINALLREHSVAKHIQRISSARLRETANEILNFTAYNCRGTIIRSSYYGICFEYEKRLIGEMIPMEKHIFLTLIDNLERQNTFRITDESEPREFESAIRDTFKTYSDALAS